DVWFAEVLFDAFGVRVALGRRSAGSPSSSSTGVATSGPAGVTAPGAADTAAADTAATGVATPGTTAAGGGAAGPASPGSTAGAAHADRRVENAYAQVAPVIRKPEIEAILVAVFRVTLIALELIQEGATDHRHAGADQPES